MPRTKPKSKPGTHRATAHSSAPPTVSGRWIMGALVGVVAAAALCVWMVLCLLFWQGSWQLLYHPSPTIAKTPASISLAYDPIGFAATGDGVPRLSGWWVPAAPDSRYSRYTVLYLHGQDGNLTNTVDALSEMHHAGVNVFAFDYRGYGQSQFARPSEQHWLEDTAWALDYLTATRHIDPHSIIVYGTFLGANLALEIAGAHKDLAGVVVDSTINNAMAFTFGDARARLVPAHLLVRDRFDLDAAATALKIPVLWFENETPPSPNSPSRTYGYNDEPAAYREIANRKTLVWLNPTHNRNRDRSAAFTRWLDGM